MPEPKGLLIVPVGFRADGTLRALELTDSDELKVALATADGSDLLTELETKLETTDLEIVTSIPSTGPHGWIGGAWQRNPLQLGYSDRIKVRKYGSSTGDASTSAYTDALGAGEIHVVNFVSFSHNDTVNRVVTLYTDDQSISYAFGSVAVAVPYTTYADTTMFILKEGDRVRFRCWGLANTKVITCYLWGYRVDIDQ